MDAPSLPIGDFKVHVLKDGIYRAPIGDLIHVRGEPARQSAIDAWTSPDFSVDVNCFALDGPGGLWMIDAGAGTAWGPAYGKAPAALRDAGFSATDVSAVLLTHIHGDHALGLFEGEKARYPNARLLIPRGDLAYYGDSAILEATPKENRSSFRTVAKLREIYGTRIEVFEAGPVLPGISAIDLPGHTPGHTGFLIHGGRENLLVWGDVVHLDTLQLADPAVGFDYDRDPELALRSRRHALESAVGENWLVAGSHITGVHRVKRHGDGFAFTGERDA
ncbi:MBL fold metallo-hydrolase [Mesorhizobium sp. LHD-90]|uniref:MBL fold metallo-hydrolase n=1 Tax=Mesorhizobium sp. LHD-90 TaxID=3071414 RepID=UPI0027DFF7AD|nr:MBL fold metallo-hydrolase [Mesorhizobium sp. LHD-90]MDQ6437569.1 MBL fold metallo-hydrolase [Mesorhizobium sp. LHD-90]